MFKKLICALLVSSFATSAMASPPTAPMIEVPADVQEELLQVDESEIIATENPSFEGAIKIVGRGLQNRETGEVIALACVGKPLTGSTEPSCNTLQHFKVNPTTRESKWIGNAVALSSQGEPTQKELRDQVKELNQAVEKYKKQNNTAARNLNLALVATGAAIVGLLVFVILPVMKNTQNFNPSDSKALLIFGAPALGITFVHGLISNPFFAKSGALSSAMADQNGWNWSSQPKVVSKKTFLWLERYLNVGAN